MQKNQAMADQSYANHKRVVKGFHMLLGALIVLGLLGSLVNIYFQVSTRDAIFESILVTVLFVCAALLFLYTREFPIKAQDRAIRAEEGLRYYILTHKPFDKRLNLRQIIALRFADDDEFVNLADRAVRDNLSADEIKRAIRKWRPDHHRA
jgi:hypothetical protein